MGVRIRRSIVVGGAAILVTLATSLGAGAGVASAAPAPEGVTVLANGVTVDAQGRVDYNINLGALPGATVSTEVGTRTATGSCSFDTSGRGTAGNAKVQIITELSFDPTNCTRELATASYARNALPASVQAKVDAKEESTDSQSATATGPTKGAPEASPKTTWSGSLKVNVEDPPQIDVTTTKSYLTWTSGSVSSTHKAEWGWYSPSGWSRVSYGWTHNNYGNYAYTDSTAHYRNGVFCLTIDTHTYHNKTYFEGWNSGYWYWSYSVNKTGGCTSLLHYEYIVDAP